jgi:sugar phosphate isomerase/epimerase
MIVAEQKTEAASRKKISALRLGVRAHDFGRMAADELASRIAAQGFSCVQLALSKAIAGLDLRAGDLNSELACEIGGAFARHGVGIEVLGCYVNPIHPDLPTRKNLLEFFKDHLRFARDFGCGLVALESGSVNADYSPHPANHGEAAFQEMLASIGELVAEAEKFGVCVGFEAVHYHTVSSAQKMRRVLNAICSKNLSVVFDTANLLTPENFREQSRIIPEALDLLGDDIAVVHAKDLVYENGALKTVPAGRGELDFAPVLEFVRSQKSGVNVLLEEADEQASPPAADFLRKHFQEIES